MPPQTTVTCLLRASRRPQRPAFRRLAVLFWFLSACLGCGGAAGPARYDLSGAVTYQGKPVPVGYILFGPDQARGNDGPGSGAEIKDGVYHTRPGQGTIGGPHKITINAFDGQAYQVGPVRNPMGKPLCPTFETKLDLPKQSSVQDFEISTKSQ